MNAMRCVIWKCPKSVKLSLTGPSRKISDDGNQLRRLNGLGQVHLESGEQRIAAIFGSCKAGDGRRGDSLAALCLMLADFSYQIVTVFVRHSDIRQEHVRTVALNDRKRVAGGSCQ